MTAEVSPAAGWANQPFVGPGATEAEVDAATVRALSMAEAHRQRKLEWERLLGAPVFMATTILPNTQGGSFGPAKNRAGRDLRWWLWAPHRRLLIDVFEAMLPPADELQVRAEFAQAHGLQYAIVQPGERLSLTRLREVIEAKEA